MLAPIPILILLSACSRPGIKDYDSGPCGCDCPDDTGAPPVDTGDPDTGSGSGDTGVPPDTGETGETDEPENTYEYLHGTRHFVSDSWVLTCEETVSDEGRAIESTNPDLPALAEACPACTLFYRIETSPSTICEYIDIGSEMVVGVRLADGFALVYYFTGDWDGSMVATLLTEYAEWDGSTLSFSYPFNYWGVDFGVESTVELASE